MPRYGIVAPDGKTITNMIVVPERNRRDGPRKAAAIAQLEQQAADLGDGSTVVEFDKLPDRQRGLGEVYEWDGDAKRVITNTVERVE